MTPGILDKNPFQKYGFSPLFDNKETTIFPTAVAVTWLTKSCIFVRGLRCTFTSMWGLTELANMQRFRQNRLFLSRLSSGKSSQLFLDLS